MPSGTQIKRTGSAVNTTQQKENGANNHAGFTINQATADGEEEEEEEEGEEDDEEWLSSSGAQTPNQDDSDSDTASEGERIPQELLNQLQRTQLSKHQQQAAHAPVPLTRVETARQSDFNTALAEGAGVPIETPSMQTSFPTTNSDPGVSADRKSQFVERHQAPPSQPAPDRQSNHTRSESRQTHHSKRHSITRPPSTHSISSRPDGMRPHPLIRGLSQGHFNTPHKPTPLAPLAVIADQSSGGSDGNLATSPSSVKTSVTSPGGFVEFPHERRSSISSVRSISILPSQSTILPPKSHDRIRTMSTMSASSTALSSLTHLPSVTRPPSPQQISFFPPVNPHVNIEAIHPLLPAPYLNNHLTVLARRTPLRESYNRVIQAKIASGR